MAKFRKLGEYASVTRNKNKRKRKRPLTPEEINHFENKIKIHKQVLLDPFGLSEREWTSRS